MSPTSVPRLLSPDSSPPYWAFDKGILGLDEGERILHIAAAFVAQSDGGLPLESLENRPLAVLARTQSIHGRFLQWHRNNVYLGE